MNPLGMKASFKTHIHRQFFILSLLTAILLFALLSLLYEEIEESLFESLESKVNDEQRHYLAENRNRPEVWRTENAVSAFVPSNTTHFPDLPALFRDLPVPYFDEIEIEDKEYLVEVRQLPFGVIYVAMETAPIEERETVFQLWLIAISVVFVGVSSILARFTARRILKPLSELTEEISHIDPQNKMTRVSEVYDDRELKAIATSFNHYLSSLEDHATREKMLISMASHELRTPIAVVSGALDVLDERGTLNEKDKKTVERIRSATTVMNANVKSILMLARKQTTNKCETKSFLKDLIQSVTQELIGAEPTYKIRLLIVQNQINHEVFGDPSLMRMLLRNLIQNALEHTQGKVTLLQNEQGLQITDEGAGLPENARLQLNQKTSQLPNAANESGLGLFIVTLISERLGWWIETDVQRQRGTCLQLHFPRPV